MTTLTCILCGLTCQLKLVLIWLVTEDFMSTFNLCHERHWSITMKFHDSAIAVQTVSMKYKFPFGDLGVLSTYVKSTTGNRAILKMLPSGELWITTWPSKPLTRVLVIWRRKARESVCKLEWLYIAYE